MRDFGSIVNEKKIPWVRHWIAATYEFSQDFRKENGEIDFEALGREEYEFRKALYTGELSLNKRAEYLWNEAMNIHSVKSENGKKGGRPRKDDNGAVAEVAPKVVNEDSHRTAAASPAEPVVMNLAYSGEFGNVRLTQEEYSELGIRFSNKRALDRAIDSLSCQIENGEKNPKSHYAELVKWATYRDDMDEKKELEESKPKMTNMEKSFFAAMKKVEMM